MVARQQNYHQRSARIMTQGVIPYKYEEEKKDTGMTGWAGLPAYLRLSICDGLIGDDREASSCEAAWLD